MPSQSIPALKIFTDLIQAPQRVLSLRRFIDTSTMIFANQIFDGVDSHRTTPGYGPANLQVIAVVSGVYLPVFY